MIIQKKVIILEKEYNLIYKNYSDSDTCRGSLKILFGKVHIVSLQIIRHGFIQVCCGNGRHRFTTILAAKVKVLKHLTNS